MPKTFIARLEQQHQYDQTTATIVWQDPTPKRWVDVYGTLAAGDTAIFLSKNKLQIGEFDSAILNNSIRIRNVRETKIQNDDVLRINSICPEIISRIKGKFHPFISPVQIDVNNIFIEATTDKFISFYIVKEGKAALITPPLKNNDRIIEVNDQGKFTEIFIFDKGVFRPANFGTDYFNIRNRTLPEILALHQAAKKDNAKRTPNNVKSVEEIMNVISQKSFYRFRSFGEYYNITHNKKLYLGVPAPDEGDDETIDIDQNENPFNMPLNRILYGPPGTGKTFHSISHAVAIVDNISIEVVIERCRTDRAGVKARYDKLVEEGLINFCTFHQSMSYEDFIEGIKPLPPKPDDDFLKYAVEPGIFSGICSLAKNSYVEYFNKESNVETAFEPLYNIFKNWASAEIANDEEVIILTKEHLQYSIISINDDAVTLVKVGGTEQKVVKKSKLLTLANATPDHTILDNFTKHFRKYVGGNTTIAWAVLNAVRKHKSEEEAQKINIDDLTQEHYKADNPLRFVLIIDEINRGNVSQIFGELITLIEEDKRLGNDEAMKVKLPYSGDEFGVPRNVYIIGTMNTADRSVEALDTALRRRFTFVPMMPEETILSPTNDGIDLSKLLATINERLRILKDSDHTLGHAWLMGVNSLGDLRKAFGNKILPLLQEYFYNDYEKLGLVLGDEFYTKNEVIKKGVFAKFADSKVLVGQYSKARQYELKEATELTIGNFQSLYAPNVIVPDAD